MCKTRRFIPPQEKARHKNAIPYKREKYSMKDLDKEYK